jgi:probable blue pigment (indigoidine) exporter
MVLAGVSSVDLRGVLASIGAMGMSSLGYVLAKKWGGGIDVLSLTAWQLVAGALVLLPVAVVVEGAPPALDGAAVLGFAYVTVIATALAFAAWFAGLRHLDAGTVGLVGLLNPVTGVLLGTALAAEVLSVRQLCGLALVLTGIMLAARGSADSAPTQRGEQKLFPRDPRRGSGGSENRGPHGSTRGGAGECRARAGG